MHDEGADDEDETEGHRPKDAREGLVPLTVEHGVPLAHGDDLRGLLRVDDDAIVPQRRDRVEVGRSADGLHAGDGPG